MLFSASLRVKGAKIVENRYDFLQAAVCANNRGLAEVFRVMIFGFLKNPFAKILIFSHSMFTFRKPMNEPLQKVKIFYLLVFIA